MNSLAARIAEEIRRKGPMTIERFWTMALFDRREGYYATAMPFGAEGDFVTAPDISQMFGELLGAWAVSAWRQLGEPAPFLLAELGPGRGTLMSDVLRTARQLDAGFLKAARLRLVETSDRLAALQLQTLSSFDLPLVRARRIEELPALPTILLANELFDALPIRQFERDADGWRERLVGLNDCGALCFVTSDEPVRLPSSIEGRSPQPGDVIEISPARDRMAALIGACLAREGGAALIVDYGHLRSGYGDTLQAMRRHGFAGVLETPGRRDITSHVDFQRLSEALGASGAFLAPCSTQGDFLLALGLLERAGRLGARQDEAGRGAIEAAVRRLAGSGKGEMGTLFKVLAAASRPLDLPPFGNAGAAQPGRSAAAAGGARID